QFSAAVFRECPFRRRRLGPTRQRAAVGTCARPHEYFIDILVEQS
ncbi:unnamed protein product, partial [marine sediment metagenome]